MKEYFVDGEAAAVLLARMWSPRQTGKRYASYHRDNVISCHDVFISYEGGILLIERKIEPAKGLLWPVGGRMEKGLKTEESLRNKAAEESNLHLDDLTDLGHARTFFAEDPFGHGKGTDTHNAVYVAMGYGPLQLDRHHKNPRIILPTEYNKISESLHPYVRDFMRLAFLKLR